MEKHERLRWARKQRFPTAAAAVEALGISKGTYAGHEAGTRDFDNAAAELYARRFGVPFAWLALGQGPAPKEAVATDAPVMVAETHEVRVAEEMPFLDTRSMPRDVPVLGVTVGGQDHDFELNGEIVDYVRRPPGIANRKGVYALHVLGTSMVPRYREGELVYVDSNRVPAIGDDGVFQIEREDEDQDRPARSLIKTVIRRSPTKITVEQYNPAKPIELDLHDIRAQHRVIPWVEVLGF